MGCIQKQAAYQKKSIDTERSTKQSKSDQSPQSKIDQHFINQRTSESNLLEKVQESQLNQDENLSNIKMKPRMRKKSLFLDYDMDESEKPRTIPSPKAFFQGSIGSIMPKIVSEKPDPTYTIKRKVSPLKRKLSKRYALLRIDMGEINQL